MYFLQVLINMTLGTSQIFSFSAGPDFDNICSAQRKITAMQLKRCGWHSYLLRHLSRV